MMKKMTVRVVAAAVSLVAGSVLVATLSPIGTAGAHPVSDAPADVDGRMAEMRERFADHREGGGKGIRVERAEGHDQLTQKRARRAHFAGQVANFLGMERHELGEALRGGTTLAELAGDRTDDLVADLVAAASERIEQAVADGKLDRDRADEILGGVEARATARVNGEHPAHRAGPATGHRPPGDAPTGVLTGSFRRAI